MQILMSKIDLVGQIRHDHNDLSLLISGRMNAWCDGLPIHSIKPGHFINSIEWISIQKMQETQQDFGWEQQILVYPDEDSVFIKVNIPSYFTKSWIEASGHRHSSRSAC